MEEWGEHHLCVVILSLEFCSFALCSLVTPWSYPEHFHRNTPKGIAR